MLVTRWQAPLIPSLEQIKMIFVAEGLEPIEETFPQEGKVRDHKHPFDEVRMVVQGELMVNVAGNQLLLRSGDRIEIPSNTKHQYQTFGSDECKCIIAHRPPL